MLEDEIIKKDQVKKMFQRKKKKEEEEEWGLNHLEKKIEIGWNHKKTLNSKNYLK